MYTIQKGSVELGTRAANLLLDEAYEMLIPSSYGQLVVIDTKNEVELD